MKEADSIAELEIDLSAADDEPLLSVGALVDGKYAIQRVIGKGGSGTVYEAQHVTVGHRVAIKVMNPGRAKRPDTLARFQREAKICGTIRHPNVGQIYDVGVLEDGNPFMVLELHEGQSLGDVLAESILPLAAIIEIARQLLAGLAAVHDAGAVHRDVKPDNAMLVRALNGDIVVKLVDFGISKIVRADIRERALTRENSILGSPDYMSPEQLRGHEVDPRTDLYAVGVLLYAAVTGRTPFDAENLADLLVAVVRDPVIPPCELRSDCPAELEFVIMKALSRNPESRYQSADEMSRQLAQVQRAVRYAPDPGIALLRQPMPRRTAPTRIARSPRVVKPLPATEEVDPTPLADTSRPSARTRKPMILVSAIAAGALLSFLAARVLFADAAMPSALPAAAAQAAPRAQASDARPSSAPSSAQREPVTAVTPSAPQVELPAVNVTQADPPAAKPPISAKRARRSRPSQPAPLDQARAAETTGAAVIEATPTPTAEPSVKALLDEATSAFVLGQMPRARSLYQQVIERAPAQADAWRGLGLAASRMGQDTDAKRAFERYLKLRPNAPDAERIGEQLERLR